MKHDCPYCKCERIERARALIDEAAERYGSYNKAGAAFSERFGLYVGPQHYQSSGARIFTRIRTGEGPITERTLDRIEVFLAG